MNNLPFFDQANIHSHYSSSTGKEYGNLMNGEQAVTMLLIDEADLHVGKGGFLCWKKRMPTLS